MDAVVPKSEKRSRKGDKLTRQQVGNRLKQVYADIVSEPVPDRFMDLIDQLDSGKEENQHPDKSGEQKDKS